jgi:hypothetical protein
MQPSLLGDVLANDCILPQSRRTEVPFSQGCHIGRLEAFWRVNRAGGPVHYALYEPGGVL